MQFQGRILASITQRVRERITLGRTRTPSVEFGRDSYPFPPIAVWEYVTYRRYQIGIQFVTPYGFGDPQYVKFSETLDIAGGGPRFGVKEVNFGPPIRQRLREQTACQATQSGSATGLGTYPEIPPPIWPQALRTAEPRITKKNPWFEEAIGCEI